MFFLFRKQRVETEKGFTMVELIVSVAIIAIITTITLTNHARFSGTIFLTNQAYDVALSIRQAQVLGLSVQEFAGVSDPFEIGYGVHFDSADNDSFFLYADLDKDGQYTSPLESATPDQVSEQLTLTRGNVISNFCATPMGVGATEECADGGLLTELDVSFVRPDPDAVISIPISPDTQARARVVLQSRDGDERTVLIESTGQISVMQP